MKIWFESLTGKQSLLSHHLALELEKLGHSSFFTTREYDFADLNLQRYKRAHISVGKYGGSSLEGKLIASANRVLKLTTIISKQDPEVLISFPSPDAHRIAFGLGIPIIQLNDTPHASAVARLTLSLTNALIYPSSIEKHEFSQYGVTNFIPYNGVDEALWIKSFKPRINILEEFRLEKNKYIVIRCEESKSSYFKQLYPEFVPGSTIVGDLIGDLKEKGFEYQFVVFPRYKEQRDQLREHDVIIPNDSVDTLSLVHYASVCMTGGGTMGREAALLGTPSVYTFPDPVTVSKYVSDLGFPLYHFPNHLKVSEKIIELIQIPRMKEEKRLEALDKIDTPVNTILQVLNQI